MCWSLPVLASLWILIGEYVLSNWRSTLATVSISSLYFLMIGKSAIKNGVKQIRNNLNTDIDFLDLFALPIEDGIFFLITNLIIVLQLSIFDKAWIILDTFPALVQNTVNEFSNIRKKRLLAEIIELSMSITYVKYFIRSLLLSASIFPQEYLRAYEAALTRLKKRWYLFYIASFALPILIKQDLIVLGIFGGSTDDLIDEASSNEEAINNLKMMTEWLDIVYDELDNDSRQDSLCLTELRRKCQSKTIISFLDPEKAKQIHHFLQKRVPNEAYDSFLLLSTVVHRIPRYPFDELLRGYYWDTERLKQTVNENRQNVKGKTIIQNVDELIQYFRWVGGCTGDKFVWDILSYENSNIVDRTDCIQKRCEILAKSNDLGVSIVLINAARDIRKDAEKYGRVYIPVEWFHEQNPIQFKILNIDSSDLVQPSPSHLSDLLAAFSAKSDVNLDCFPYATYTSQLLDIAEKFYHESIEGIQDLPTSVRRPFRLMIEITREFGHELLKYDLSAYSSQNYYWRGKLSKKKLLWTAIKVLWGPS